MKHVVIVGAGALGSHVAMLLRSEDVSLHVIDFDKVESKNTLAQFHSKGSVGRNKAVALQQLMNFVWSTKLDAVPHKLTKDNVDVLLLKGDLVIDCLDNGEGRRIIQANVRARGIPCLHGALAPGGEFGRVIWDKDFVIDDETAGAPTCEDGAFLPFIAVTASWLAYAAQQFLRTSKQTGFHVHPGGTVRI